jgi:putative methionine-R-sulfoxide reductase with GAF domain
MNPLLLFALFTVNLLTLALALSVLMVAVWQRPGDPLGRAVIQFLAVLSFYNLSVLFMLAALILGNPPMIAMIAANLTVIGFALCVISAFSLVVTMAGVMRQALQVLARAGVVIFLLIQWPLWFGGFFNVSAPDHLMREYTPAGIVAAAAGLIYIVLTLGVIWVYRRRIDQPTILAGIVLLLAAQLVTLFDADLREVGFPSLISVVVSAVLGYNLIRLFGPLRQQTAQLEAVRDIGRVLTGSQDIDRVLTTVVRQARQVLNTDFAMLLTRAEDGMLVVSAHDGTGASSDDVGGRRLPVGDGLCGRVFELQQPMRLTDYSAWNGRSQVFADLPFHASLCVPLCYSSEALGVLAVYELNAGRLFSDLDQAALETLAPHAAIAIANANLRQRVEVLQVQ